MIFIAGENHVLVTLPRQGVEFILIYSLDVFWLAVACEIHAKGCMKACLTASRKKQWGEVSVFSEPQLFIHLFWCVNDSYLPKVLELLPDPHGFTRHQEYSCSSQTSSLHFIPNKLCCSSVLNKTFCLPFQCLTKKIGYKKVPFLKHISHFSNSSNQKESAYIEDISVSPSSHNKQSQSSSGLAVFKANGNVPERNWVHRTFVLCLNYTSHKVIQHSCPLWVSCFVIFA